MTQPNGKELVALVFVMSIFLVVIGGFVGISALDSYLKRNNYVLCNIDDLKKATDILNGNIYETKPQLIIHDIAQKQNTTYKNPFAKEWVMSKEVE